MGFGEHCTTTVYNCAEQSRAQLQSIKRVEQLHCIAQSWIVEHKEHCTAVKHYIAEDKAESEKEPEGVEVAAT